MSRQSRGSTRRRRLVLETLSDRICLAVDAVIDGGMLTIRGGAEDDAAWIREDGRGTAHVRDLETGAGSDSLDVQIRYSIRGSRCAIGCCG